VRHRSQIRVVAFSSEVAIPVRVKKTRQTKNLGPVLIQSEPERL
jgi:hypothetical protein